MALYRYFTRERLTPYEIPLSFRQTSRKNERRSEAYARSTTNIRHIRLKTWCSRTQLLHTAQPPYLHFDTSIERSNWAERSGYVAWQLRMSLLAIAKTTRDNILRNILSLKQPNGIGDRSAKLNSRRIFQPYGIDYRLFKPHSRWSSCLFCVLQWTNAARSFT